MAETFSIRQMSQEFAVTPRAIRFYEDKGLLSPARDGMNRVYVKRDRGRLALIVRMKRLGLSLSEIREILDLYELKDDGESQGRVALLRFRERVASLEQQRVEIDRAIVELRQGCGAIELYLAETAEKRDRPDDRSLIGFGVPQSEST